jgi:hypothetical protein
LNESSQRVVVVIDGHGFSVVDVLEDVEEVVDVDDVVVDSTRVTVDVVADGHWVAFATTWPSGHTNCMGGAS